MKLKTIALKSTKDELPLVPMGDLVTFPHMVVPFFAGKPSSVNAIETAMSKDRMLLLIPCTDDTLKRGEGCPDFGTSAKILQMLKLPDGSLRILAEGKERAHISKIISKRDYYSAHCEPVEEDRQLNAEITALMNTVLDIFKRFSKNKKKIPQDTINAIEHAEYPDKLIDLIAPHSGIRTEKKIELLGIQEAGKRLEQLAIFLESENEVLNIQNRISTKVKKRMERNQREYFLNEQLKEINRELGKDTDDSNGASELLRKLKSRKPPQEILQKAEKECSRLEKLQPMSPESGVLRTYLEWLADLPWDEKSQDNKDIEIAASILDEDHYNMKKPKERILDFIAVRQLNPKLKGPILCFVGPPGTGKTSLGKSVARALNRNFVRISLGGVRDEAEIRGHRKTYVGALPGKIIQAMKKADTRNPVFLLDEIDKINSDFRGDPASALLEVLDPEQNSSFTDHYLEVPYDLSEVMFITTANSTHSIPHPLLDRMEVIEVPGYTDIEKVAIATNFIIPKQLKENGLDWADVRFTDQGILGLIHSYTMESGVRNLEREVSSIIRKIARQAVKDGFTEIEKRSEPFAMTVDENSLSGYLGKEKFVKDLRYKEMKPGLAHGLAWTEMGGTLLPVEVASFSGSGELILTGSLGDVMKESARTALSFLKANRACLGLPQDFQKEIDIHIHVPEGAIPKDGPSAGITLTAALYSLFKKTPLLQGFAMTGEITLTGRILPIGGVKEKVLAAYRNEMTDVILPEQNKKDLEDIPEEVQEKTRFHFLSSAIEGLKLLFPDLVFDDNTNAEENSA
ncbi:MAG: endopeptidase La [Spirochaetales bacterium]|nr:endopeptidase La [Spirochaetales bacterium]